jgi:hypothetical protein
VLNFRNARETEAHPAFAMRVGMEFFGKQKDFVISDEFGG